MSLKLMYITNRTDVAKIADENGVDRIFIDMEYIGKEERQGGLDSVKCFHTVEDVRAISSTLKNAELLVRVNPIHEATAEYSSSKEEIDAVVEAGADIIMLPMAKTVLEVKRFLEYVSERTKTMLLLETAEAADIVEDILSLGGIDEVHIGLNDLHLSKGKKFMFELLTDGTVEDLCKKIGSFGVLYGFGGIARLGYGMLPAENVITEHYRLGSSMAILSRSFCNIDKASGLEEIETTFKYEMEKIRAFEEGVSKYTKEMFDKNQAETVLLVEKIVERG